MCKAHNSPKMPFFINCSHKSTHVVLGIEWKTSQSLLEGRKRRKEREMKGPYFLAEAIYLETKMECVW